MISASDVVRLRQSLVAVVEQLDLLLDDTVQEFFSTPTKEYHFSKRTAAALKRAGILTVDQLIANSEADLLRLEGFGPKLLDEIKKKLAENGEALASTQAQRANG